MMSEEKKLEHSRKEVGSVETESKSKSPKDVEKEQEAQLRAKYPLIKPGGSSLLQKRLSRGTKQYFDSGDYNMAKAKTKMGPPTSKVVPVSQKLIMPESDVTGDAIPTPDTVPQRKTSIHTQSKLAGGSLLS